VITKTCRDCGETKPAGEFYKNPANRDGLGCYCRGCNRARNRASYRKHQVKRRAYDRERYSAAEWREHRRRHRAKHWIKYAHEKLVLRAKGPAASKDELEALWRRQGGRCGLTGVPLDGVRPHLDHIVPRSRGGADTIGNLRFVHPMANHAKGAQSDAVFLAWLDAVIEARDRNDDQHFAAPRAA